MLNIFQKFFLQIRFLNLKKKKKDSTLHNIFSMSCMSILEKDRKVPLTPKSLKMVRKHKGNTEIWKTVPSRYHLSFIPFSIKSLSNADADVISTLFPWIFRNLVKSISLIYESRWRHYFFKVIGLEQTMEVRSNSKE